MAALVAAGIASGCQSATQAPIIRPGAPGQPSRSVSAAEASDLSRVGYTPADVEFMQGMIAHHAQAIEMTTLLKTRTESEDMRRMAQRIDLSQTDEINMMRDWLRARGQDVPDEHAHHTHMMPGMLTPEQMQKLSEARGREFDRLFLEGMIAHHQGALTMVADLLAKPGAGQASDVFEFASDVEGDQRMEIQRMSSMLQEMSR